MSTSYTANALMAKSADGDRSWGPLVRSNLDFLDAVSAIGLLLVTPKEVPSSTLNVRVTAGTFRTSDGTLVPFAGSASQPVTASTTTMLWLTDAGVLTAGTSFPASTWHVRLASVVASASTVTSVTDERVSLGSSGQSLSTVYLSLLGGTLADGANLALGTGTGTQIGTAATQKLGLFGVTPVVQPASSAQAPISALTATALTDSTGGTSSGTLAACTNTSALTDSSGGTSSTTLAVIADAPTADAIASLAAELAIQRTLNGVLVNAVASLAAQVNHLVADVGSIKTLANALRSGNVAVGVVKGS